MWFRLRYTERRGRSVLPDTLNRMRALRRSRRSRFFWMVDSLMALSRPRLALLAADDFLGVLDALALVRLGWPHLADLRGGEPHQVLVGALHRDPVRLRVVLGADAFGQREADRVREADDELDLLALQLGLVAHARDVQRALEPLRDALDHVGDQRARQAVQLARAARVVGAVRLHQAVLDRDLHLAVELLRHLPLGALHLDQAGLRVDLHLVGDLDGESSDAGHVALLPDRGEQLAAQVLLARLAVDHHAARGGEDRDAEPVHDRRDVAVREIAAQARLGLPADLADRRALVRVVLEDHRQDALLAVLLGGDLADEALVAQHLADALLDLAGRQLDLLEAGALGVADPGQEVRDWIGQAHLQFLRPAVPSGALARCGLRLATCG